MEFFCDICGEQFEPYSSHSNKCKICERDICSKHKEWDPLDDGTPDYRTDIYCTDCMKIAKKMDYFNQIETFKFEYDDKKYILFGALKENCLNNIRKKENEHNL